MSESITNLGVLFLGGFVGFILSHLISIPSKVNPKIVATVLGAALSGAPILFMEGLSWKSMGVRPTQLTENRKNRLAKLFRILTCQMCRPNTHALAKKLRPVSNTLAAYRKVSENKRISRKR